MPSSKAYVVLDYIILRIFVLTSGVQMLERNVSVITIRIFCVEDEFAYFRRTIPTNDQKQYFLIAAV